MPFIVCEICGTESAGIPGKSIPRCGKCLGGGGEAPMYYMMAKRDFTRPNRDDPADLEDRYDDESGPDDVVDDSPNVVRSGTGQAIARERRTPK